MAFDVEELERQCLLIGNTRWHWAHFNADRWQYFHTAPNVLKLQSLEKPLSAWAAVGSVPLEVDLDPLLRLELKQIPLSGLPPWLGIDRALAALAAFRRSRAQGLGGSGLLLVDVGTVLSLTRITKDGEFAGGQLAAGLRLQLIAMANAANALSDPGISPIGHDSFPFKTEEAMRKGSLQSILGLIVEAHHQCQLPLWLCGGDAPYVLKGLENKGISAFHYPNLALEGMVEVQARFRLGKDH